MFSISETVQLRKQKKRMDQKLRTSFLKVNIFNMLYSFSDPVLFPAIELRSSPSNMSLVYFAHKGVWRAWNPAYLTQNIADAMCRTKGHLYDCESHTL